MKKIIMVLLVLGSTASYACQCVDPQFSDSDTEATVLSFMKEKLGVSEVDVVELNKTRSEGFLGPIGNVLMSVSTIGMGDMQKSCEMDCAKSANEKSIFDVTYLSKNKTCTQKLYVKMKSDVFKVGYSSSVKTKQAPHCI